MSTQTAIAITAIGKPLEKVSLPVPEPQEHALLIKVTSAGLAPFDQKLRDYGFFNLGERLPAVLGLDIAGTVVRSGPNAESFSVGAHVFSQGIMSYSTGGALQEYTIVDARYTALVPKNISATDAVIYPVNAFTSATGLFDESGLGIPFPGSPASKTFDYASQKLVIIGGGSNCGKLATMFARIAGIGSIIVIAGLSGAAELKSYGATHVVDRKAADVVEQIHKLTGDDLIYVFDSVNTGDHNLGVNLLSTTKKGTLAHLLQGEISEETKAKKKAGFEEKNIFGASPAHPELGEAFWKVFPTWLESGEVSLLKYNVIDGLDVEKVNQVLDEYRDNTRASGERSHVKLA